MEKTRIRKKYLKWSSRENYLAYKKIKNKCNMLIRKTKQKYLIKIQLQRVTSKTFWNAIKPFIRNKGRD